MQKMGEPGKSDSATVSLYMFPEHFYQGKLIGRYLVASITP